MQDVELKVFPNRRALRWVAPLGVFVVLAGPAAFTVAPFNPLQGVVLLITLLFFLGFVRDSMALVSERPLLWVGAERIRLYSPFGYVAIPYDEIVQVRVVNYLFVRVLVLRLRARNSAEFASRLGKVLYTLLRLGSTDTHRIQSYMLTGDVGAVAALILKRKDAAEEARKDRFTTGRKRAPRLDDPQLDAPGRDDPARGEPLFG